MVKKPGQKLAADRVFVQCTALDPCGENGMRSFSFVSACLHFLKP